MLSRALALALQQSDGQASDLDALNELRALLAPRVEEANSGDLFDISAQDIADEGGARLKSQP